MPQRNMMWRVGCFTMMRRAGRSCRGKYTRLLIISALGELSFSCRLKMVGYSAKAFSWSYLLHIYESVVADCCVRRGRGGIAGSSLVYPVLGMLVGGDLVGGNS